MLLACWGVDSLIGLSSVSFPASVALLIVLFFALILCETTLGNQKTKKIIQIIDIPVSHLHAKSWDIGLMIYQAGFALRYINVFFTPSFGQFFIACSSYSLKAGFKRVFTDLELILSSPFTSQ